MINPTPPKSYLHGDIAIVIMMKGSENETTIENESETVFGGIGGGRVTGIGIRIEAEIGRNRARWHGVIVRAVFAARMVDQYLMKVEGGCLDDIMKTVTKGRGLSVDMIGRNARVGTLTIDIIVIDVAIVLTIAIKMTITAITIASTAIDGRPLPG